MGIYQNGKKMGGLVLGNQKIAGAYLNGNQIFSSFLPAGTSLWQSGNSNGIGFSTYYHNSYIKNTNSVDITIPIRKIKTGLNFNFNMAYVFSGNDAIPEMGDSAYQKVSAIGGNVKGLVYLNQSPTIQQLKNGVQIIKPTLNGSATAGNDQFIYPITATLSGTTITFTTTGSSIDIHHTQGTLIYGGDNLGLAFALLKSITAY